MPVKTNAQLAAFFNTGDQPSETEFGHLIDTIQPAHVTMADANVSLTVADHAYRLLIWPDMDGGKTITMPTPAADVWFHIVHGIHAAADGVTLTIDAEDKSFLGQIQSFDTDATSGVSITPVFATTADDGITIPTSAGFDLWFHGKDTASWYVWGWALTTGIATATNI